MQKYHSNATTNLHIRGEINKSSQKNNFLAQKYNISENTVSKWKNADCLKDKSSRPHKINYALDQITSAIIVSLRKSTWMPQAELHEIVQRIDANASESAVYRTLVRNKINKVPKKKREQAKKFKEYEPGFLHIDVTYLPKIEGVKNYLFVAIDRATRLLYYELYHEKSAENAATFLKNCKEFFPFIIDIVITDNGLEFTNRLIKSKKGELCKKKSLFDIECESDENKPIEHRLTKPNTPKTNGMVERANGTIKNATILNTKYMSISEMEEDLIKFLLYYNLNRRHGSLKKELGVRTPIEAVKKWYEIKPEIFYEKPCEIEKKLRHLQNKITQKKTTTL